MAGWQSVGTTSLGAMNAMGLEVITACVTTQGRLKSRDLTSREWTTWHQIARVEIARIVLLFEYLIDIGFSVLRCFWQRELL